MNVFAVGGKHRSSADQAAKDGEGRLENRQAERDNRNRDCDNGWRLLRSFESKCAQQEADEQAARVSQKNRCRIEVVTQKTKDRSGESDGHYRDQRVSVQKRDYKRDQRREQCRAGRQAVEAVDEVESVRNRQYPQNGQRESDKPG